MSLDQFVRAATARVEAVRVVGSAVNPLLWLTGIISPLSLALAVWTNDVFLREALFGLALFPVLTTIVAYSIFMFKDPDRLQSEEYRLRQRALQMIYARGTDVKIVDPDQDIGSIDKNLGSLDKGDSL